MSKNIFRRFFQSPADNKEEDYWSYSASLSPSIALSASVAISSSIASFSIDEDEDDHFHELFIRNSCPYCNRTMQPIPYEDECFHNGFECPGCGYRPSPNKE